MNKLPFQKSNYIMLLISTLLIVLGYFLMSGSSTTLEFNEDIFSFRRITLSVIVAMTGYVGVFVAILWKGSKTKKGDE